MTIGRTLYAIVDPRGFRPLWLGRLGQGYVVVSETCALDLIGATPVRELEPGEFLRVQGSPPEVDKLPSLPSKPHQRCIFELVYFSRPDSTIFGRSVDRVRRALGRELAREHPAPDADCVFSVPDSSNAMALGFAEESGLKLEHALIRNHYVGRTFINPTQASRNAKVKIKFNPVREVLAGKKVVVVDDSLVRGTTSRELVQMIRQVLRGVEHAGEASPRRPSRGPATTASTRRPSRSSSRRAIRSRRSAGIWGWNRSAICRWRECCAPREAIRASFATPVSPAATPRQSRTTYRKHATPRLW